MGLRSITIATDSVKPGGYFGDKTPSSLAIIKCHQDEVLVLPESATLLAYSDKYNVEMASFGDHFLSIQGHPEYNKEILFEIIDRVVSLKLMEVCVVSVSLCELCPMSLMLQVECFFFLVAARSCG